MGGGVRSWRKGGARVGRRGGTVSDACWPGPERRARGVRARGEEDSPPCAEGGAGGVRGGERCRCMHVPDWIEPRKGRRGVPGLSETKTGPRTHLRNVRGAAINTQNNRSKRIYSKEEPEICMPSLMIAA